MLPSLAPRGLAALDADLREARTSSEALTREALDRIAAWEPRLRAFTFVDPERALAAARAADSRRRAGAAGNPLCGMPFAIKDLFTVDGMPTNAGSRLPIQDLVPAQGPLVAALLEAGCVPVGKTRTTEFAMGGFNLSDPPPWNPCDLETPRMTGGSSHGSAVAMAAGLAAFALGSDTGGSVRWPAALCGVAGYKASTPHWSCEGVFPMSPDLDAPGVFARSVEDAAFVEAALASRKLGAVPAIDSLRIAVPTEHFFQDLEPPVAACFEAALRRLREAGAPIVERPVPEAGWIDDVFSRLVPTDVLRFLGRERVTRHRELLDPVAAARLEAGFAVTPEDYEAMQALRRRAEQAMAERSAGIDAWIMPTVSVLPHPTSGYRNVADVAAWNRRCTWNTRPGNLFGQCGVSLPIQHLGADLPVGLMLMASRGHDARLLDVARSVEGLLGIP